MPTKLGRKEMPSGYGASDFSYQGRPANEQDDFGPDVGVADCACVNQFGKANNSKHYHGGVLKAKDGSWWVYLEWGRIAGGKSWEGGAFQGQDFQFVQCSGEEDARAFFEKQMRTKNIKRLEMKKIGSTEIWVGKKGKDGYVVQRLATRERGLPDAYSIKDDTGVKKKATKKKATKKKGKHKKIDAQPQVIQLARDLVGGTADYARAAQQASGIVPTMEAILEVRDELIPDALTLLAKIGNDEEKQLKSKKLQDLSKYVATIVPRPIPRSGDASAIILSKDNIFAIQQDLDTFEAALLNEDFDVEEQTQDEIDPNHIIGREITWVDPNSTRGRWISNMFHGMTNNRHGYVGRGKAKIRNIFEVRKDPLRKAFLARAKDLAKQRKGERHNRAGLQPSKRTDVSDISDIYTEANICVGIHGTRAVNVQPILNGNLRLPKSLKGVHITGAAFGDGIYFATDWKKSYGYTGHGRSVWVKGGGIKSRGFFMFLCDLTLGKCHMASSAWSINGCPRGTDSVFANSTHTSVQNDEHVIFDANQQDIRYIIEGDL